MIIESERHILLKKLSLTFHDGDRAIYRSIITGDPVSVFIETLGAQPGFFDGVVSGIEKGSTKDEIKIIAVCQAKHLIDSKLTQTWSNETPESIISYAISNAGLTAGQIKQTGVVIPHFTARNSSVVEIARNCEYTLKNSFNFDVSNYALFSDNDNTVNWGDSYNDSAVFEISSNENLIRHSVGTTKFNHSVIETFLTPSMLHSMRIHINDTPRDINESVRALKVKHSIYKDQYRTFISYGNEHEKY